MRSLMGMILVGLFAAAELAAQNPAEPMRERPNFVFILADDLGWGDLGCYGHPHIRTPNLDRLASQGTLFTQFYVNGSVCSPSRCAFFTGQYPARHRIHGHYATVQQNAARGMSQFLDPAVLNVASLLRAAGYRTAHIGKWHLGSQSGGPDPRAYGFDFVGSTERGGANGPAGDPYYRAKSTALFVDEALEFIRDQPDRPFYLQLWTLVPHATLNPTPEQMEPYQAFRPGGRNFPHASAAEIYYASVTDLDTQIGRLIRELDAMGLAEKTIIFFSSDNGPEDIHIRNAGHSGVGSAGPFRGRKRSLYEGGVRVPAILRWTGHVPAGRVDNESVWAAVDWLPTVCRLAGVTVPDHHLLDGEPMDDVWLGQSRPRRTKLYWEWRFRIAGEPFHHSPQLAIRDGYWKLYVNPDGSRLELYDMRTDHMQWNNLAEKYPEVAQRLKEDLLAWAGTLPEGPRDPGAGKVHYGWPAASR
ncbi:MAG: N-acetylgalactosamine-6-sulfatase [Pirellulaceae bacterium]|nr:MAG: N-acetylgalactosamine-6-sulfatase [Pirellulaceae bacterium]